MPLVLLVGTPCSGKTRRARELKDYFEQRGKQVHIVSEEEVIRKLGYEKNATYMDAQKEKRMRGVLKSEVMKLIGKDNVVILDGSNYIKGFRYELYCASKAAKSTQCTIYTIRNHNEAMEANRERRGTGRNTESSGADKDVTCKVSDTDHRIDEVDSEPYTDEVFEALTKFRFEEPNLQHRWDSPLFTVQTTDELDTAAVYRALCENKPPPPNMSTQNPPLSSTNFLYELDRVTQAVSAQVLEAKRMNSLRLADYPDCPLEPALLECVTPQRLLRLRRQFLTYARQQYAGESTALPRHYLRYLNASIHE